MTSSNLPNDEDSRAANDNIWWQTWSKINCNWMCYVHCIIFWIVSFSVIVLRFFRIITCLRWSRTSKKYFRTKFYFSPKPVSPPRIFNLRDHLIIRKNKWPVLLFWLQSCPIIMNPSPSSQSELLEPITLTSFDGKTFTVPEKDRVSI